jgi:ABC-2 type transport system ATP-binding protein
VLDPAQRSEAIMLLSRTFETTVHMGPDAAGLSASVSQPGRVTDALAQLTRSGIAISDFNFGRPSLDEVFLALTGQPIRQNATTSKEDAA